KVVINADAAHFASKLETALGTLERCYRVECRLRLVPQPHEHTEGTGRVDGVVQPGDLQPGRIVLPEVGERERDRGLIDDGVQADDCTVCQPEGQHPLASK